MDFFKEKGRLEEQPILDHRLDLASLAYATYLLEEFSFMF